MTAGIYHTVIEQGEDFDLTVFWRDGNGNAVDLTDCSAEMMIRQCVDDPVPLITLSSPGGGLVLGGTDGTIKITIPAASTAALASGRNVYDLKVTDSLGKQHRLIQGNINTSPAVTR